MLHLSVKNKPINIKHRLALVWCALFSFLLIFPFSSTAQSNPTTNAEQSLTDRQADSMRVKQLVDQAGQLYGPNPDSAMIVARDAIDLATQLDLKEDLGYAYKNLGLAYYVKGDYDKVMEHWTKSLEIFEEIDFKVGISNLQNNIGAVYQTKGDDSKALEYFLDAVRNAEAIGDSLRIASAYVNIGTVYVNDPEDKLDEALDAYSIAMDMFRELNNVQGLAVTAINIGEVYIKKGQPEESLDHLEESLELFKELGMDHSLSLMLLGKASFDMGKEQTAEEYYREAIKVSDANQTKMQQAKAYNALADLQLLKNRYNQAIGNYNRALDVSLKTEVLREQEGAYDGLAKSYAGLNDFKKAFEFQKLHESISDSIQSEEDATVVENLRFEFQTEKKEQEIELLNAQNELAQVQIDRDARAKQFLYITLGLFLAIIAGVIYQYLFIRKSNRQLAFERNKSEQILLNILPKETAEELKEHGQIKAKQFDMITVLFTDFKEFSVKAEEISPDQLVKSVDFYFKAFDEITERHNLEKIKTIGDSFMCAGGIPTENDTHAEDAYNASIEMMEFCNTVAADPPAGIQTFDVRIGLNSGPVVAGVVGIKKFAYDIWGSTVNIASRMESSSEAGKINVSENTYQLLKDKKSFTYRGEIEVKNKQVLKMYFADIGVPEIEEPKTAQIA